jgi:hypothetical protein
MVLRKRDGLAAIVVAAGLMIAVGATSVAQASHIRPKSATPIRESLIPAHNKCGAPNRTHGPTFTLPSCNPPVNVSPNLTTGTPDNNTLPANMASQVKLQIQSTPPDILLLASINDQYCKPTFAGACTSTGEALNDYVGGLNVNIEFRLSDHWNAVTSGGGSDPATVIDLPPIPWPVTCTAVGPGTPGGQCTSSTTLNSLIPGAVLGGKRESWEVLNLVVQDGGSDSDPATTPNDTWLVRGLFQP